MTSLARICLQKVISHSPRINVCRNFSVSSFSQSQATRNPATDDVLVGLGKYEMQAKQVGNDNPFDTYVLKPDAGTGLYQKAPILIPSIDDKRMVGCCCEDDYTDIVWFELSKGGTQRCDCGFFFKLIDYDPLDKNIKPTYGKGFGSGMSKYY